MSDEKAAVLEIPCAECGKQVAADQINGDPDHDLCLCDDCADEIIAEQEAQNV